MRLIRDETSNSHYFPLVTLPGRRPGDGEWLQKFLTSMQSRKRRQQRRRGPEVFLGRPRNTGSGTGPSPTSVPSRRRRPQGGNWLRPRNTESRNRPSSATKQPRGRRPTQRPGNIPREFTDDSSNLPKGKSLTECPKI